ncbi:glycosyltransferase family 2 protein [Aestuariivivens sediminis]|uniref:glycosyltransferase family 2 protein n=1 Tax=Aestuariivivens sediminis TaxID=2913557 RepID=UPI001F5A8B2E|nr:glycosyltransferase family A protein [Aestuariivivens sediminis]
MPLVSIIIPLYNRKELILDTLQSILAQTFTNWECFVVDDGSTDDSLSILKSFTKQEERVFLLKRPASMIKGASSCRNYGLAHAKGDLVWFFDSDDVMLPNTLEDRICLVNSYPQMDFWVFQTQRFYKTLGDDLFVWNDLSKPNEADLDDFMDINPVWHTSGPLWKRSFLYESDLLFYDAAKSWQDWEFHVRVLLKQPRYRKNPELQVGVFQRFHDGESINKLNDHETIYNRLDTLSMIIKELKNKKMFIRRRQIQAAKLFYFLIKQLPLNEPIIPVWSVYTSTLNKLPYLDMQFWPLYLNAKRNQGQIGYFRFYKILEYFKKLYFSKHMTVDELNNRTWYKQQLT